MGNGCSNASIVDVDFANGTRWREGTNEFITAKSHAALAIGDVVVVSASATGPLTAAAATSSFVVETGVVCQTATAANEWVKIQTKGFVEAYVEGTTDVAAGDTLEVLNTENEFKKDGTAVSTVTAAIAVDAQAANSNALVTVYLPGTLHTIAAS